MLVIWIAGAQLEPVLGRTRFTLLYFASLLAGSAGALLVTPNTLTIGASGAAFGLLGALAIGMRHRGIDIWRSGIGPLIAINLVITVAVPGISLGGHVGGLIGGLAAGWVLLKPRRPGVRPADHRPAGADRRDGARGRGVGGRCQLTRSAQLTGRPRNRRTSFGCTRCAPRSDDHLPGGAMIRAASATSTVS